MAVRLSGYGYGHYDELWDESTRNLNYDYMKKVFASKGYQFIPSMNDIDDDIYIGEEGVAHGYEYMDNLIASGQILTFIVECHITSIDRIKDSDQQHDAVAASMTFL